VNLEVDGTFADANQGRTAVLHTLKVGTVTGDTSYLVDLLTFVYQCSGVLLGNSGLRIWGQGVGDEACAR